MRPRNLLALGVASLPACGTNPEDFGRCSGGLEVAVDGPSGPLWSLFIDEPDNRIASPVRYGQPASAGESQSPVPGPEGPSLMPGSRYVVSLRRIENGFVTLAGAHLARQCTRTARSRGRLLFPHV